MPALLECSSAPSGDATDAYDESDLTPRDWQRFYMGYKERFVDACVLPLRGGAVIVSLLQAPSARSSQQAHEAQRSRHAGTAASRGKGAGPETSDRGSDPALTGTTVWDGGVVLSQALTASDWLTRHRDGRPWPSGSVLPHCLELGAGTGAVGLSLAACHMAASVTITDIPDMLPHLELNVKQNSAAIQSGPASCIKAAAAGSRRPTGPSAAQRLPLAAAAGFASISPTAPAAASCASPPVRPAGHQVVSTTVSAAPSATQRFVLPPRPVPPPVYVRPLRWGPPGEDIEALAAQHQLPQQPQPGARLGGTHIQPSPPAPGPPYDVIVGSDLIYYTYSEETPHSKLLLWTLLRLSTPLTLIYLALSLHHNPEEVEHFLGLAGEDFDVLHLHQEVPAAFRVHDVTVVRLRLKKGDVAQVEGDENLADACL